MLIDDTFNRCPTLLPSLPSLPPASVGVAYAQQLQAFGGASGINWTATSLLPGGLTLSSAGLLSGSLQSAGMYTIAVQASDGVTADTRSYLLRVSGGTTINDASSTRAPGFTPQFRVATLPSPGISATASCNLNEFVVTGGGTCTVPNVNTVQGRIASSVPSQNGWQVTCSGGTATAIAVCSLK